MNEQMCCQSPIVSWTQGQEEGQFTLSCTGCGTIWEPAHPESSQAVVTGIAEAGAEIDHLEIRVRNIEAILAGRDLNGWTGTDNKTDADQQGYQLAWTELDEKISSTTPTTWNRKRLNDAMRAIEVEQGISAEAPAK
jgi:hypothetical protein